MIAPIEEVPIQALTKFLLERLFYISHPSVSQLECVIKLFPIINTNSPILYRIASEIVEMSGTNPEHVHLNPRTLSILFKGASAMKLLRFLFDGHEEHALYTIYFKWTQEKAVKRS